MSAEPGIGWQADGPYVPCPQCRWEPPPLSRRERERPGVVLHLVPRVPGSATHEGDCPVVDLPAEVKAKLRADLDEMDRCRRRAWASARNYVIG